MNNDKNRLHHLKCYHGVQRKEEVAKLMKDAPVGMFLIRSVFVKNEVALGLILSVKVSAGDPDTSVHHYTIDYKVNEYVLMQEYKDQGVSVVNASKPFATLEDMIEYYQVGRESIRAVLRIAAPPSGVQDPSVETVKETFLAAETLPDQVRGERKTWKWQLLHRVQGEAAQETRRDQGRGDQGVEGLGEGVGSADGDPQLAVRRSSHHDELQACQCDLREFLWRRLRELITCSCTVWRVIFLRSWSVWSSVQAEVWRTR